MKGKAMELKKATWMDWLNIAALFIWGVVMAACSLYGLATDNIMLLLGGLSGLFLLGNILLYQRINKLEKIVDSLPLDNPPQR